jgi:hypothetical protein
MGEFVNLMVPLAYQGVRGAVSPDGKAVCATPAGFGFAGSQWNIKVSAA